MVDRIHSILMLTAIIGHLLFGCACQHAQAKVKDADRSETATAGERHRFGLTNASAIPVDSITVAAACALCGEHNDSVPRPCEDNCCTFVKSPGVQVSSLTSAGLCLSVVSPALVAVCHPDQGQMQNADATPSGRPLSADSRDWLASWLL